MNNKNLDYYLERKRMWVGVSEDFDFYWEFIEKRVLGDVLARNRSSVIYWAAIFKNLLFYRKSINLKIKTNQCNRWFWLGLEERSDHSPQIENIKSMLPLDGEISSYGNRSIKVSFSRRLRALYRAITLSSQAFLANLVEFKDIPLLLNTILKFEIDHFLGRKLIALNTFGKNSIVCALSIEGCRGFVKSLGEAKARVVVFQHGIQNFNGGFSEERNADLLVLWADRYLQNQLAQSKIVVPTKLAVYPTMKPFLARSNNVDDDRIDVVIYISCPSLSSKGDVDREMMCYIKREMQYHKQKLVFCLHPSKSVKDYPELRGATVVRGLRGLPESLINPLFVGVHSSALISKALAGAKVCLLEGPDASATSLHRFPGVVYHSTEQVFSLIEIGDKMEKSEGLSEMLRIYCYGEPPSNVSLTNLILENLECT